MHSQHNTKKDFSRHDEYSWIRDPNWPNSTDQKILDYLNKWNDECEDYLKPIQPKIEEIFKEMKGRIKEDDMSVPVKRDDYFYYSYIKAGQSYWTRARKYKSMDATEEIILDENKEAKGRDFFRIGGYSISPDHSKVAYTLDLNGSEKFQIYIREIKTGELLDSAVEDVFGETVWDVDNAGLFYVPTGEEWRAEKVYHHKLKTKQSDDTLVYKESDKTFWVGIEKSEDKNYLFITAKSGNSSEVYYINLHTKTLTPTLTFPRKNDVIYYLSHHSGYFYIMTNDKGRNNRIARFKLSESLDKAEELYPTSKDVYIKNFNLYKNHLCVEQRELGLAKIELMNLQDKSKHTIQFDEEAFDTSVEFTTFDADSVRYEYSSLACPRTTYEYVFETGEYRTLKVQEIPSGFNKSDYHVKREWATAADGTKVPISLVHKKSLMKKDGSNPLYLYGYGSYGYAVPASFRASIISLLDRGFVYAIGHIRGGDDLGFEWYESAKFLNKKRTFEDFISCAKHLIDTKYTSKGHITISGGSAGGMLMGYCVNNAPELYKASILHVPFVDVLNTMLDDSLPLTPLEFKEWGNPKDDGFYEYIESYSPFDNIKAQNYPNIFITSGLNDPRVTYWEPAKFAAKLQDLKLDNNALLLKTNMSAGHGGKSGRYDALKELAEEFAFVVDCY